MWEVRLGTLLAQISEARSERIRSFSDTEFLGQVSWPIFVANREQGAFFGRFVLELFVAKFPRTSRPSFDANRDEGARFWVVCCWEPF